VTVLTMTDFQAELQRIEADIQTIRATTSGAEVLTPDAGGQVRLLCREFQRIALTGEIHLLRSLNEQVDTALEASSHMVDLWLLKAHIALKRHRFDEAESALRAAPSLESSSPARLLQSDIDWQQGRYHVAQQTIESVLAVDTTWDAFARLAQVTYLMGNLREADELYAAAEDEVSAKQMQTFAWLETQRGFMHFQRGDYTQAMSHYNRAKSAFSGYWLVEERLAELQGAQGQFEEAIADYLRLYANSPRPEWAHALGDLYWLSGSYELADTWKRRAYSQYVKCVADGETYFLHYLTDLCGELAGHQAEAIEWARRDLSLRNNFTTQADLAWALFRGDQITEAVEHIATATAVGMASARLYQQAAVIFSAVEQNDLGRYYARLAITTNPHPAKAFIPSHNLTVVWSAG
jgi:tetratricopeptide (TPR) repeat protein